MATANAAANARGEPLFAWLGQDLSADKSCRDAVAKVNADRIAAAAKLGGVKKIDYLVITHFHADHWLGLPGMLKSFDLRGRETPLCVYGPAGLRELLAGVMRYAGRTIFEIRVVELEPNEVLERDGYRIAAVPVAHRSPAYAYVLFEAERPGAFDPDAAVARGLQPGPDFGRLQRHSEIRGLRHQQVLKRGLLGGVPYT